MNRKVLAILTFLVLIAGASAVSAFDLEDLFKVEQTARVGDIEFNIPEGFNVDQNSSKENDTFEENHNSSYTLSTGKFINSSGDIIKISVSKPGNIDVTDEVIKSLSDNKTKMTVNGVTGYDVTIDGLDGIVYAKHGKIVFINVSDKKLLKDVIRD